MEAKLIKNPEGYDTPYILTNMEDNLIASTEGKLSLKNCEAIENGYSIEEIDALFKKVPHTVQNEEDYWKCRAGFITGFQTAMEILGDKKFSSGQLLNAMDLVWQWMNGEDYGCKTLTEVQDKHIQSLQQTEWEVEIYMECDGIETGLCDENCTCNVFPKLDADGNLILKRK